MSIFRVAVRALLSGRRWIAVATLNALFLVLAVIVAGTTARDAQAKALVDLYRNLLLPLLVPFCVLLFATEALGAEVEDRTLVYLTLRPIASPAIVAQKYAAAALLSLAALWPVTIVGFLIMTRADAPAGLLPALLVATFVAVLAYSAIFLLLGLIMRRALLIGAVYVLLWEGAIAGVSTAAAHLSVRLYALGAFAGVLNRDDLLSPADAGPAAAASVLTLLIVSILAVAYTSVRLRRTELT